YANTSSSTGHSVRGVADNSWQELTLTANNAPTFGSIVGASGAFAAGSWTQVDVRSVLQGGSSNNFAITSVSSAGVSYSSREGANPPQLVIAISAGTPTTPTPTPTRTATTTPTPTPTRTAT